MESGGAGEMKTAQERLLQASHKLAEVMYQQAQQQPQQQTPPSSGDGAGAESSAKKDDVVDAEFVDVDENKK
jgi:molecular chaperone DnaK